MRRNVLAVAVVVVVVVSAAGIEACSSDPTSELGAGKPATTPGSVIDGGEPARSDASTKVGSDAAAEPLPPTPSGCITDVSPGDHTFTCEGFSTDVSIPAACVKPGCGLITELHGDTGTGALMDANTNLKALGKQRGFVVVAPTGSPWPGGPGNTWNSPPAADDEKVVKIIQKVAEVFRTDPKKNHLTGFSRGGFVTWRLLCKHANLFASIAPATAGSANGTSNGFTCDGVPIDSCPFDGSPGGSPSVEVPIVFLMGRTDVPVPLGCTSRIREQVIAAWGLGNQATVDGDANYTHSRWTNAKGTVLETFEHSYETEPSGPFGYAKGHCFPGSTLDPFAPQYAVPCKGPDAFTWGERVMAFFEAHPKK